MRILYVTNGFPFPLTSGHLRHYFLIRELARAHAVTLVSMVGRGFVSEHADAMRPYTDRVITVIAGARGGTRQQKIVSRVQASITGPVELRRMRTAVEQLVREHTYDAVVVNGKPTYQAIDGLALPPIVADMCDATSMRLQGQLRYAGRLRRALLWLDCRQVRRVEQAILRGTDHVLFASVRDRQAMVVSPLSPVSVLPNGIDTGFWKRKSTHLDTDRIVFTGAMSYAPNVDAAIYLIEQILPLVRRVLPRVEVLIVGHSPAPALLKAATQPGVTVTGFVEDVRPYLEQAAVFVAPVRFGAGIQNKLLEALSMEVPVIASPLAADGLKTEDGEAPPVQIADTPGDYAEAILQQLLVRRSRPAPASEGRCYVKRHFSWATSGARLNAIIESVARARRESRVA